MLAEQHLPRRRIGFIPTGALEFVRVKNGGTPIDTLDVTKQPLTQ